MSNTIKQYCRYCNNALDYNGEATDFLCETDNRFYPASKAKRINKCKNFEFNENDIFRYDADGNFATYKPRDKYAKRQPKEQIKHEQLTIDT